MAIKDLTRPRKRHFIDYRTMVDPNNTSNDLTHNSKPTDIEEREVEQTLYEGEKSNEEHLPSKTKHTVYDKQKSPNEKQRARRRDLANVCVGSKQSHRNLGGNKRKKIQREVLKNMKKIKKQKEKE